MTEYPFTLRFKVSDVGLDVDECVEFLAASGCDDALIGIGTPGRIALDFIRESSSAEDAVLSAISDVKGALPQAVLIEATPDFVGYSEVADIVGRSRQNIRKLLMTCKTSAPVPVHEGVSTVWHLAPVLKWLRDEKDYEIEKDIIELACTNMHVNITATQVNYEFVTDESIRHILSAG